MRTEQEIKEEKQKLVYYFLNNLDVEDKRGMYTKISLKNLRLKIQILDWCLGNSNGKI